MTREEAIAYFKRHIDLYCVTGICREAEEMAIKALEQQPCEDAISREDAIKQCGFGMTSLHIADNLQRLPSVTPRRPITECEDAISRADAIKTAIEAADDWDGGCNLTRADIIEKAIESLPSVQPKAKTGYWECNELFGDGEIQFVNIRCSECGNEMRISPYRYNRLHELEKYCSICGCKMEG